MFTRSLAFYIFGGIEMDTFFVNSDRTEYVADDIFHTNVSL